MWGSVMENEPLENLDHYLKEMELPFQSPVVIALIREALAGPGDPPDIISRRIYQIAGAILPGKEAPLLFEQLIFDLYKSEKRDFRPDEDAEVAPLRGKNLDLIDRWMQLSDFLNEEEQKSLDGNNEIQLEMRELMGFLHSLMDRLNHPGDENSESLQELGFLLDQSERVFSRFMDQVEELINPHAAAMKKAANEDSLLVLRVDLKDAGCPVWRKIRVPAFLTLHQFHQVLQKVMGWWDLYDHSFDQAGSFWGESAEEDDNIVYQDESECLLRTLLNEEDDLLHYRYDLPEGWHHIIRVEEVLDGDGSTEPVCLDGKGSCPPEDCGGPEGFRMLLASLKPDASPELKEDFSWVGDFDPDCFNRDEVNRELKSLLL